MAVNESTSERKSERQRGHKIVPRPSEPLYGSEAALDRLPGLLGHLSPCEALRWAHRASKALCHLLV